MEAFQVLVFFGSVVSLLYYYGIMQWVLKRMASLMQLTLGTTAVESLNACACVFLGQSEAALLVRPYLEKQTPSELHAIMASGFSCIAGSLFAAYVSFGACPKYLLSSSVMSAPASLAFAKIMFPEVEESESRKVSDLNLPPSEENNAIECISNGAMSGIHIVVAIAANLNLLQYVMFPVAYIMGVTGDTRETLAVARLIATKTAVNEFVAYRHLGEMISDDSLHITPRSTMIATYALCSFSNLGTIGIAMGVLGGMAPSKRACISRGWPSVH
ncbi:nucleoside transporter, NupC family [Cooperia oncophora]